MMKNMYKIFVLLTFLILSHASLSAQWVACTNAPGNDSIYTTPAGIGLRDLAVNGSRLFAMRIASADSIFYSDDYGSTWQVSKPPGVVIAGTTYYPSLAHVWVHDGTIFCSGTQGTSGGTLYFWRSSDNGTTWTASSNGITSAYPGPTPQVLYGDGTTLYAGTVNSGVFLSTDNGLNWLPARHGIATYTFGGFTDFANINGLAAIGNDIFAGLGGNLSAVGYGVVHTTLGDTSWTTVSTGLPANSVIAAIVAVGSTLYASASSFGTFVYGIYESTDLGVSWTKVVAGLPYPGNLKTLYVSGNTIFGFSGVGLYELNTNDTTWTAVNAAGLPATYAIEGYGVMGTSMFVTGLDLSVPLKTTTHVWKRSLGEITEVREVSPTIPQSFSLQQNFPNPFNPSTKIRFELRTAGHVTIKVYDVLGREVETLVNEYLSAGSFETTIDASRLAGGVYLYRIQAGSFVETKKMMFAK